MREDANEEREGVEEEGAGGEVLPSTARTTMCQCDGQLVVQTDCGSPCLASNDKKCLDKFVSTHFIHCRDLLTD